MRRPHGLDNLYKRKDLIESCLWFQKVSPLSLWWGAWFHTGKHDAGEVSENYILICRQQSGKERYLDFWNLKAHTKWQTCSDEATLPNLSHSSTPLLLIIQIPEHTWSFSFKSAQVDKPLTTSTNMFCVISLYFLPHRSHYCQRGRSLL